MTETASVAPPDATIIIRGRQYAVERIERPGKELRYRLTGKRGASFFTMRNVHRPDAMFVVPHSLGNKTLEGVWLSDKTGELVVLEA